MSTTHSYIERCHALLHMADETFWERLTKRYIEKWPSRKPTQKALAALIHVSQPSANKWANGKLPELSHVVELAQKLDVCVEWLLTGRGEKFPSDASHFLVSELHRIAYALLDQDREPQLMELVRYAAFILQGDGKRALSR